MTDRQRLEEDALRYGFQRVVSNDRHGGVRWRITCGCGTEDVRGWPGVDPDSMLKLYRKLGWTIKWNKTPKCPKCSHSSPVPQHNKKEREKYVKPEKPKSEPPTIELTATPELEEENNIEIIFTEQEEEENNAVLHVPEEKTVSAGYALIIDIAHKLDEVWVPDVKTPKLGVYKTGWSDDAVAKSLDASPDVVVKIRKERYGELAVSPAIAECRHALDLLTTMFGEDLKKLTDKQEAEIKKLDQQQATEISLMKATYDRKLAELHAKFMLLPGAPHPKASG